MGKKQTQQLEEALNEGAGGIEKVKQVKFSLNCSWCNLIDSNFSKLNLPSLRSSVCRLQVGKELGLRAKQISSWLKKRNVG